MRMRMTPYAPSPELAPHVGSLMVVEAETESTSHLLPTAGVALGFRYRGAAHDERGCLPMAALTGLRTTSRRHRTSAKGGIIVAALHPSGASRFFADDLRELFGRTVPLVDLVGPRDVAEVLERLAEAPNEIGRVAVVDAFLRRRLSDKARDRLVERAVEQIVSRQGRLRIAGLAADLGVGQDALEKRFRRAVGGTPKQLASIVRLQRAVELHRLGASLTRAAFDAGFADIRCRRSAKGADRTLDDIFFGLGLLVSLYLLVSTLVALRVASADASQWAIVAPFAWGLCAAQTVTAAVAARYFFAGPAVLCGVAALLFGVGAARR